jgi:hypothetical protein
MMIDASATRDLLSRLSASRSKGFTNQYTEDLWRCVDALERQSSSIDPMDTVRNSHQQPVLAINILAALSPNNLSEKILSHAGLWPSIGPESLLGQLSLHSREGLPNSWRNALTSLAEDLAA